jgi:hypothetical protein
MRERARLFFMLMIITSVSLISCGGGGAGGPSDTTQPIVDTGTISPKPDAVGVSVNSPLSVSFSEPMDDSTILTATVQFSGGGETVPGIVTFSGQTATFTPAAILHYNTVYTVTITGAKDIAGNPVADYSWIFTTGSDVPSNPMVAPGNEQVIVTWDPRDGATSYNIYWSNTAGVTKATGTLIEGATSPFVHHTGAGSNGTTFYYVVTSVSIYGESAAIAEMNATPTLAPPPPPPPGT